MFTVPSSKTAFGIFLIFATGVMAGYLVFSLMDIHRHTNETSPSRQVRQVGEYHYTNPLLECEVAAGTVDARKQNFRDELVAYIDDLKEKRGLTEAAVYFRDLNNGPAFGIDEEGGFFPASLLKVPVMMAYYRWSEQEPELLAGLSGSSLHVTSAYQWLSSLARSSYPGQSIQSRSLSGA